MALLTGQELDITWKRRPGPPKQLLVVVYDNDALFWEAGLGTQRVHRLARATAQRARCTRI